MTLLNEADVINYNTGTASAVYVGTTKVWKLDALTMSGTPVTTGVEYEGSSGGAPYVGFTVTASGGVAPYIYSLAAGSLPVGITLNSSTGEVSGAPAALTEGVYPNIVIRAIDSVGATGKLAPFTLTISYTDPYYSAVRLLLDYNSFNGDTSFVDQRFGTMGTPRSGARHSTALFPPYGTSSIVMANSTFGDAIIFVDDPKWDLGALPFTIDFVVRPVSGIFSTNVWVGQWGSSVLSWVFFQENNNAVALNVSLTGSDNVRVLTTVAGALSLNVWSRWRIDYDGTAYRIYKNGVMMAKAVLTNTKAASNQVLSIGANAPGNGLNFTGNCRGIRLTVGYARTASDSGYLTTDRAFPFVPFVPTTVAFETATATNVNLFGANLAVTNTGGGVTTQGARVAAAFGKTSGKFYFEVTLAVLTGSAGGATGAGIATTASTYAGMSNNATTGVELFFLGTGQIWTVGSIPASLGMRTQGDIIGFAVDLDNGRFWCRVAPSGNWNGSGTATPATPSTGIVIPAGTITPICTFGGVGATVGQQITANFGNSPFTGAVPASFTAGWPLPSSEFVTPVNTVLPSIAGTARVGSVLVALNGSWTGPAVSYAYQWKRGGTNIGTNSPSYALVVGDLAATLTVDVTATNSAGSATATSAATVVITAATVLKSIDGSAGGQFSGSSSGTVTLSTTKTNDVIVLLYYHESNNNPARTISTVTSPNLTWTKRSNYSPTIGTNPCDFEIWWAPSAAIRTSEVITITLTGGIDDAAYIAFGVNGCSNISAPWDTHASWATARATGSSVTSLTVPNTSADSAVPMVVGFTGTFNNFTVLTPAGTSKIRVDQNNGGGSLYAYLASFHQINTQPVSAASYASTAASVGTWGMVLDALA